MTHVLHIEDEGFDNTAVGSRARMRPYCQCGWLGERERTFEPQHARQECREQFYRHLQEMNEPQPRRMRSI